MQVPEILLKSFKNGQSSQHKWMDLEGNGTPLQYSYLENPVDGGAWKAAVHGVAKSDTTERLHFHFSLSCIGEGNGNPLQWVRESQGQGSLVGCSPWGHTELDTTEAT